MHFTSRTMTCVIGLTWALAGCSQSSGLPTSFHPLDPRAAAQPHIELLRPQFDLRRVAVLEGYDWRPLFPDSPFRGPLPL
jgi:hypothetical protein